MLVDDKISVATYRLSVFIKAILCMLVKIQTLQGTYRLLPGHGSHLGIAVCCMGMLCQAAPVFFHGNGG